jgi:hypothetical protein
MFGQVKSTFANPTYLTQQCQIPIQVNNASAEQEFRSDYVATECDAIEYSVESFRDYNTLLQDWAQKVTNSSFDSKASHEIPDSLLDTSDLKNTEQYGRPSPRGPFSSNLNYESTWIEVVNTTELSNKFNRPINNVTLALPHAGIVQAAIDPKSDVLQPTVRTPHYGLLIP